MPDSNQPPEWYTPAEAAAIWGITPGALYKRTFHAGIPAEAVTRTAGGHRRYRGDYIRRLAPRRKAGAS